MSHHICYSRANGAVEFNRNSPDGAMFTLSETTWGVAWDSLITLQIRGRTHVLLVRFSVPFQWQLRVLSETKGDVVAHGTLDTAWTHIFLTDLSEGLWSTYSSTSGDTELFRFGDDGKLSSVAKATWSSGITNFVPMTMAGNFYLFSYGASDGAWEVNIWKRSGLKTLGKSTWSAGWTHFTVLEFFERSVSRSQVVQCYNTRTGEWCHLRFEVSDDDGDIRGSAPVVVRKGNWPAGYTAFLTFRLESMCFLLSYRTTDGLFSLSRFAEEGATLTKMRGGTYPLGYTTFLPWGATQSYQSSLTLQPSELKYLADNSLNPGRCADILRISADALTCSYLLTVDAGPDSSVGCGTVQARVPFRMSDPSRAAYFEVTIINGGSTGIVTVGLTDKTYNLTKHPGWESSSIAYHGDDGMLFICTGMGKPFGSTYNTGDVVGCGIDYTNVKSGAGGRFFFTLNGKLVGVPAHLTNPSAQYYASVGFRSVGASVRCNFGASPFRFNLADVFTAEDKSSGRGSSSSSSSSSEEEDPVLALLTALLAGRAAAAAASASASASSSASSATPSSPSTVTARTAVPPTPRAASSPGPTSSNGATSPHTPAKVAASASSSSGGGAPTSPAGPLPWFKTEDGKRLNGSLVPLIQAQYPAVKFAVLTVSMLLEYSFFSRRFASVGLRVIFSPAFPTTPAYLYAFIGTGPVRQATSRGKPIREGGSTAAPPSDATGFLRLLLAKIALLETALAEQTLTTLTTDQLNYIMNTALATEGLAEKRALDRKAIDDNIGFFG